MRNKGYSDALGSFLSGGNCYFTSHLHALNLVAPSHFDREEMSSLIHFPEIVECLAWRTMDFKAICGDSER